MENENIAVFELGDPLATRCGNTLTGIFLPSSKIALSAFRPIQWNSVDAPSDTAGNDMVLVHLLQESTLYEEPLLRSLLAEANAAFVTLQTLGQGAPKAEYCRISLTYRSIIRACLEKLEHGKKSIEVQENETRLERCTEAITVFYAIECLWHLFEILYMHQNQFIVGRLLEWTRFHFPNTEDQATDLLLMAQEASESDDYWSILETLIMLGQVDVTRAILGKNRKASREAFRTAEIVLKTMPVYQDGYSLQKFQSQWDMWHADVERKLAANMFTTEPQLEVIIQLVSGNRQQWDEGMLRSQDWYEFLPGFLLYTKPTCKPFELRMEANSWLNRWSRLKPDWQMSSMSRLVGLLMEHDIKTFIYKIQELNDNHWFSTHLLDLIYQSGHLQAYCQQYKIDLPELRHSMVCEFGSFLMTTQNHWQMGIDYLDNCKQSGVSAIELLLPRIPLRTEQQTFKLIAIAKHRGLKLIEEHICKVQSKRALSDHRYGSALEWAIRSKDVLLVTSIADYILQNYSKTGHMLCPDVITCIGPRMFISQRLIFLCKYFEFYEFYRKRDFLAASDLLVNLLNSKITPDYFWPSLLIDALPLLESKDPKMFSSETVTILHHIEMELVPLIERSKQKKSNQSKPILKDYRVESVGEILNLLRLACARNLSRSWILENSPSNM